ncbi:MAG: anti-phage defense ZorAB system ZorA, partial [Deltaproteobacteria bacterium]|nr:anti-phage defense ZorAB system ZorA [Deltaproteobacteria bacterium]
MNWSLLLPHTWNPFFAYQLLFSNESLVSSRAFSALFIHVIIGIVLFFVAWALQLTIASILKTERYLVKLPKDENSTYLDNLPKLPLFQLLKQHLITVDHRDGSGRTSFHRSVEASEIFRDTLLAPNFTTSRLFLAIPGILTGLGVLGTFAGLQIGMGGLDLSNARELAQSIIPVIQGCVIAFSTSVWGVLSSLSFSGFEKVLDRVALGRIRKLQHRVDTLYRPYVPEEALSGLEKSSKSTEEILKGLAVAIGDEMQKAIGRLGSEIKDAVAKATSEGQGSLMEKSAELFSKTITAELKNLKDQIGGMGEQFKTQFTGASNDLMKSVGSFQPTVEKLTRVVAVAQQNVGNAVKKLNA